jgi:hypothetical protein
MVFIKSFTITDPSLKIPSSGMLLYVIWQKLTDISDALTVSSQQKMQAVSTHETLVNVYPTTA